MLRVPGIMSSTTADAVAGKTPEAAAPSGSGRFARLAARRSLLTTAPCARVTIKSRAEPSRAEPSRAEPSRAERPLRLAPAHRRAGAWPRGPLRTPGAPLPPSSPPGAAPRGRARKLLSSSSGLTGGRAAAAAGSRRVASAWRRLALVPVLALLLGALIGLFDAAPAQAQSAAWSGTLTVADRGTTFAGCDNGRSGSECSSTSVLTDDDFTVGGTTWSITALLSQKAQGSLWVGFDRDVRTALDGYKLCIGSTVLAFSSAAHARGNTWAVWGASAANQRWAVGETVALSIVGSGSSCPDADLSGLTVLQATSRTGTFTSLALSPSFAATTRAYTASVAAGTTNVKLRPTVSGSNATVKVGKGTTLFSVPSGSDSRSIPIVIGSNTIKVEVTAQGGTTTKTYTVTVFRPASVAAARVTLSVVSDTVREGSSVTVVATLSGPLPSDVTIPLTLTAGTAESGDYSPLSSITIPGGQTSATGTITAAQDDDTDDETFTVAVGASLPSSLALAFQSSVRVTIRDDDATAPTTAPRVSLSVLQNPVREGLHVVVQAMLSEPLPSDVTIPLTLTAGTAEAGDHGSLASITVPAGPTDPALGRGGKAFGLGSISTAEDDDLDDESFTIALGTLPPEVRAGSPSSVTVTIDDDDKPTGTPRVTLSASPNPVEEGSPVTVTATLSYKWRLTESVTIPVTLSAGTAERGDYGALASITIANGQTTGTGTVATAHDDDFDDETFTVSLGPQSSHVRAGSRNSVTVTVRDDDTDPDATQVYLIADPPIVLEGGTAKLRALLSKRAASDVTIPITVTAGTSESDDHDVSSAITISSGSITGTGTILAYQDSDADDETFTVSLGRLPSSLARGRPHGDGFYANLSDSVTVTIRDDDPAPPTGTLWSATLTVKLAATGTFGCANNEAGKECSSTSVLTDDDFTIGSTTYEITEVNNRASSGALEVDFSRDVSTVLAGYKFCVGRKALAFSSANYVHGIDYVEWSNASLNLPAGDMVTLSIVPSASSCPTTALAPLRLALGAEPGSVSPGGEVALTLRLNKPAAKRMGVLFRIAGDGGAARMGLECKSSGAHVDQILAGAREVAVRLCTAGVPAGRTIRVSAETLDPALTAAGVAVRVLGPNPPRSLTLSADPKVAAGGGVTTVTARLDRPTAPGLTVLFNLPHGLGAARWGASCASTGTVSGLHAVAIPPGGVEATAELCIGMKVPRIVVSASTDAPRLVARDLALVGPARLALRTLTVSSADPSARVPEGEVALTPQSSSYEVRVPRAVSKVTVTPAAAYSSTAVKVNGRAVGPGTPSVEVPLEVGDNAIRIEVVGTAVPAVREYTLTVTRAEAQKGPAVVAGPACTAETGPLCGIVLSAGSEAVALSPAFAPEVTSYRAAVPAGAGRVTLVAAWGGEASVFAGSRRGGTTFTRPVRVRPSGTAVDLALAPGGGATELWVMVSGPGGLTTYEIEAVEAQAQVRERPALSSDATLRALAGSTSEDGAAFGGALALDPAFAPSVTAYTASVAHGVTHVRLTPAVNDAGATVKVGTGTGLSTVASGSTSAAIALAVGANALAVEVTAADGTVKTWTVTVARAGPPLTASFEGVPPEHDGKEPFVLDVRFGEALGEGGVAPVAASFRVRSGRARGVERVGPGLWRVKVKPESWRDVRVTLAPPLGCADEGAVCASGARALANAPSATVGGPVRVRLAGGKAREGRDESLDFAVTLNRAAAHAVSVDYATADGTATAGEDYTATSGTLIFAPGMTSHTVSVPILDDAVDEGKERFVLRLSNPQGAYLRNRYREAKGVIANEDPLQRAWLARFGRTVGAQVTDAVTGRLEGGLAPGMHATLGGQSLDLSKADDGEALADAMAGFARAFGASDAPASNDDPFALGPAGGWDAPAAPAPARSMTGRELLLGSAFHLATKGEGSGPGLAAWGRVAQAGFDGEAASDTGALRLDGEVLTGTLGADAEWDRLLAGVAVSLSEGEGTFTDSGATTAAKGGVESTMTTVGPYARMQLTERVSAWGLAGWGTGNMTVRFDDGTASVKRDLSMRLGALGARGALLEPGEAGGVDLALKADAFFVRTEWERVSGETDTAADASRVRLVLEGGRAFDVGDGATFRPSLELGVRHDGGDAETGAGVELGGGVAYTDPASGLSVEAKARILAAHADSDYEEWGASAAVRLDPGERGRGLSFSLSPTLGASSSAAERLWGAQRPTDLAPNGEFEAARSLQGEMGYGLPAFGGAFTGTPNLGFGLSDGGARDYRLGWRLTSAVPGDPGFEVNLDATRREPANDAEPEHRVMFRSSIRL